MSSFSLRVHASTQSSMLASPIPPPFLDTYSLSMSSLRCKALCIVISFLALWHISWSYSLVHFNNGPEYLTRCLSLWWDFCCRALFREGFSFVGDTLSLFFLSSPLVWWCSLLIFPNSSNFPFLRAFCFFFDFAVLFLSLFVFFPLFTISMTHFSISNSIPISWLHILTIYIRVSNSFLFFGNSLYYYCCCVVSCQSQHRFKIRDIWLRRELQFEV